MNITNNTVLIDEEFTEEYFLAGTWSVWGLWLKKGDMDSAVMGVMKDSRMTNVVVIEKYTGMRSAKVDGVPQNLINSIFAVDDGIRRFEREQRNEGVGEDVSSRAIPRPPSRWPVTQRISAPAMPAIEENLMRINTPTGDTREVPALEWNTTSLEQPLVSPQRTAATRASSTIRQILNDLNDIGIQSR